MPAFVYRYELRRGDEIFATGHLTRETPLEIGDRIGVGRSEGVLREIEPTLEERERRVVIQLTPDGLDP